MGRPGQHHPTDHRPRVGVRHDGKDAGAARHLRVPQPQGHELRGHVDRDLGCREGARGLGRLGGQGPSFAPDRSPAVVPAPEGVPRLAGRLLPHASLGEVLGLPGGARNGDRRRAGGRERLHLRHRGLPSGWVRRRARSGLQHDRTPVPGRSPDWRRTSRGTSSCCARSRRIGCITSSGSTGTPAIPSTNRATGTRRPSRTTIDSSTTRLGRCSTSFPTMPSRS